MAVRRCFEVHYQTDDLDRSWWIAAQAYNTREAALVAAELMLKNPLVNQTVVVERKQPPFGRVNQFILREV